MSNLLSSKDFGQKIYDKFPPKYREDDVLQSHALKRYIEVLSDGGFSPTIDDINGITSLINPEKIDSKVLPLLFQQYGFDVFNGIPEQYLRYFLPKLGEAYSLKGSMGVVQFITSSLSGVKVGLDLYKDEYDNPSVDIKFEMDYNLGGYFPDATQFTRILNKFLPFYLSRTLMYSYMFYENEIMTGKENELLQINDLKEEMTSFISGTTFEPMTNEPTKLLNSSIKLNSMVVDTDFYKDKISYLFNELFPFNKDAIEFMDIVKTTLIKEDPRVRCVEKRSDTLMYGALDDILVIGARSKQVDSTMGVALMGQAVLGMETNNSHFIEDTYTESISTHQEEVMSFNGETKDVINITNVAPIKETPKLGVIDSLTQGVTQVYNETTSILSKGVGGTDNAVLGEGLMGASVLGEAGDFADVVKDNIIMGVVEEQSSIQQDTTKATFLNSNFGIINVNFTLNDFTNVDYDIVSYNDGRKSYIIHN